jgi:hypothetical protein
MGHDAIDVLRKHRGAAGVFEDPFKRARPTILPFRFEISLSEKPHHSSSENHRAGDLGRCELELRSSPRVLVKRQCRGACGRDAFRAFAGRATKAPLEIQARFFRVRADLASVRVLLPARTTAFCAAPTDQSLTSFARRFLFAALCSACHMLHACRRELPCVLNH